MRGKKRHTAKNTALKKHDAAAENGNFRSELNGNVNLQLKHKKY